MTLKRTDLIFSFFLLSDGHIKTDKGARHCITKMIKITFSSQNFIKYNKSQWCEHFQEKKGLGRKKIAELSILYCSQNK